MYKQQLQSSPPILINTRTIKHDVFQYIWFSVTIAKEKCTGRPTEVEGHRYNPGKCPGPVYGDFSVFTSCYAHTYCVPGYTFHPLPGQHPQSRSSNWELTDDGHRIIPPNGVTPS